MDTLLVSKLKEVKMAVDSLNSQLNELKQTKTVLEKQIIQELQADELSLARTNFGTVSLTSTAVANVDDWLKFEQYIYENKALYLLQRRVANAAYRDEVLTLGNLPGVSTYNKITLSFTNRGNNGQS